MPDSCRIHRQVISQKRHARLKNSAAPHFPVTAGSGTVRFRDENPKW